jgi:hypothetical protein
MLLNVDESKSVATQEAELARSITDSVVENFPREKADTERRMIQTARELAERGSDYADGRGQAIGSIPPNLYMRWNIMLPGCWQDREFVMEFLKDNPQCLAPGFKPKFRDVRKGFTAIGAGATFYKANKAKVA